jgi:hypothetical protein
MMGIGSMLTPAVQAADDLPRAPLELLELHLKIEFRATGRALKQRLEREAAGDPAGAQDAARAAAWHRERFLELEREIDRREATRPPPLADRPQRSPFAPEASVTGSTADGVPASNAVARASVLAIEGSLAKPPWDMYRSHEPSPDVDAGSSRLKAVPVRASDDASARWGMYERSVVTALSPRGTGAPAANAVGARDLGDALRTRTVVVRDSGVTAP